MHAGLRNWRCKKGWQERRHRKSMRQMTFGWKRIALLESRLLEITMDEIERPVEQRVTWNSFHQRRESMHWMTKIYSWHIQSMNAHTISLLCMRLSFDLKDKNNKKIQDWIHEDCNGKRDRVNYTFGMKSLFAFFWSLPRNIIRMSLPLME